MATHRRRRLRLCVGLLAAALLLLSVMRLESYRAGIERMSVMAGETPATLYRLPDSEGPLIVIAHGFAGSRQLMEAFSLTLARAGYAALAYDLQGHGRNSVPMSGDVTRIEGTTARLIAELRRVVDAGVEITGWQGPVGVLGHSMASDVVIRASLEDARIWPVVAVSMFSQAVSEREPQILLAITGAWEARLRDEALRVLQLLDPQAEEGQTVNLGEVTRRAVVAPRVEHVGVLYSPVTLQATRDWFDAAYARSGGGAPVAATGRWIVAMLASVVALVWVFAGALPYRGRAQTIALRSFLLCSLTVPPLVPLLAIQVDLSILPVLVADYLTVHLAIYGAAQLAFLWLCGIRSAALKPAFNWQAFLLLVVGIAAFGMFLDRYVASFALGGSRVSVFAMICVGAIPFMLADTALSQAGRASLIRRLGLRIGFLASLGLAVALDFERLMFLVIILPVIVLFFCVFGLMGRWVGLRSGVLPAGLSLGLILAWSLAASFPLFAG